MQGGFLKRPHTWLALIAVLALAAGADSFRTPDRQVTSRIYIGMVRIYQAAGRPITRKLVQCRYSPTCSQYSIEAVRAHGIRAGLVMTVKRIARCKSGVPFGTLDPPV